MVRELGSWSTNDTQELVLEEVEISDDERETIKTTTKKKNVHQPELSLGSPSERHLHLCNFTEQSQVNMMMMMSRKRKQSWKEDDEDDDIDLNVNHPLPIDWEQCLDLQSGKMYYLNRKTLSRIWNRPKEQNLDLELNISTSIAMNYYLDHQPELIKKKKKKKNNNNINSTVFANGAGMIAAACNNCHLLVMLAKSSPSCPNCKFLHSDVMAVAPAAKSPETLSLLK